MRVVFKFFLFTFFLAFSRLAVGTPDPTTKFPEAGEFCYVIDGKTNKGKWYDRKPELILTTYAPYLDPNTY